MWCMNTNPQASPSPEDSDPLEHEKDAGETLIQLLEELDNIDEDSTEAPLNKLSIDDNNGSRIELLKPET
jgi:hypothetical protein